MAEGLTQEYSGRGRNPSVLFAAFAGLVSARDKVVGADCLIAVGRFFSAITPAQEAPSLKVKIRLSEVDDT